MKTDGKTLGYSDIKKGINKKDSIGSVMAGTVFFSLRFLIQI